MEGLNDNEKQALLYLSGINALESTIKAEYIKDLKEVKDDDYDNILFTILFYFIAVISNPDPAVRKIILECKQNELKFQREYDDVKIQKYIDDFNVNFKMLSMKYLELNEIHKSSDEKFQEEILSSFADILMDSLKTKSEEIKSRLKKEFIRAVAVGFEFNK